MTAIATHWKDRALSIYRERVEARQREETARELAHRARLIVEFQDFLTTFLDAPIPQPEYDEERCRPYVVLDGVTFARPKSSNFGLVLVRECTDCGRKVDTDSISDLWWLGYCLENDLPYHDCGNYEADRNYRARPISMQPPPPTLDQRLLATLREFVQANLPEA